MLKKGKKERNRMEIGGKKAQITIFIILAVLIVVAVLLITYISISLKPGDNLGIAGLKMTASAAAKQMEDYMEKCLSDISIEALDTYGLDEEKVKFFITAKLETCAEKIISQYRNRFDITGKLNGINVSIDWEEIRIIADYPVNVRKDEISIDTDVPALIFQRNLILKLEHDSDCIVSRDFSLVSFDSKFEISVSKGTKATNMDGTCLENIAIRLEDPILTYGERASSITNIVYIPRPLGAFFDKPARLKLKYSELDYANYLAGQSAYPNFFLIKEDKLNLFYYDDSSANFYVYASGNGLSNVVDTEKNTIEAEVNQFYGFYLPLGEGCAAEKRTIIESVDRRVVLNIDEGTKVFEKYGNCLDKIIIDTSAKTSKVVNFGYYNYGFSPTDAKFDPYIIYIYRYTQEQLTNPVFLYGGENWQDLITGTWNPPVVTSTVKSREIGDVKIAYLDSSGVYRPWPTWVNEAEATINARMNHF